jgi:hypothetical protein
MRYPAMIVRATLPSTRIAIGTPTYVGDTYGAPFATTSTTPRGTLWSSTSYATATERSGPVTSACAILSATAETRAPVTTCCACARAACRAPASAGAHTPACALSAQTAMHAATATTRAITSAGLHLHGG